MRYFILLGLVAIVIIGGFVLMGSLLDQAKTRRAMRQALAREKKSRNAVWSEAQHVQDLVTLYMQMVAKHGVDSYEAKAFRFGTDSRLMKDLHGDNESLQAFEQQAEIIDQTYQLMKA
jgi:hypothetical protein